MMGYKKCVPTQKYGQLLKNYPSYAFLSSTLIRVVLHQYLSTGSTSKLAASEMKNQSAEGAGGLGIIRGKKVGESE